MLIVELSKGNDRVIIETKKKSINLLNFPKNNISNSEKKITSHKIFISFEDELLMANELRLANECERITPGHGLLPPEPDLNLVLTGKAAAILAAAQLLNISTSILSTVLTPSTSKYSDFLRQALEHGQKWGREIDNTLNSAIQTLSLWRAVNAHPDIQLDPDDEMTTLSQPGEPPQTVTLWNAAQKLSFVSNRKAYLDVINKIKENYPKLHEVASKYIKTALSKNPKYHSLSIDPDKTWFNRFEYAVGSDQSYTGWEHNNYPKESTTLTQMLLNNFGAEDRLNVDELSGNSGIYTQGATSNYFGASNEVKILPKDFLDIVIKSDFSKKFLKELNSFWLLNSSSYRTMAKGKFIGLMADKSSSLSEFGEYSVMIAALGDISKLPFITVGELEKKISKRNGMKISSFSINGYHATDIILIHGFDGKIILYKPTDDESFVEFNNPQELNNWVLKQVRNDINRQNLLEHFSLYDRQDGQTYSGVSTILNGLSAGKWAESYINHKSLNIKGDVFTWLATQAQERTLKDT